MFLFIESFYLDPWQWVLIIICGILIGWSKTGLSGLGLLIVPILAGIFGGKNSTGILLPMLIMADIFAVTYYNRHAQWKYVFKLLPWALTGIVIGLITGNAINDTLFKWLIGIIILLSIGIMFWRDWKKHVEVPRSFWFAALFGLLGGFSTMIGNAAGPIMSIYLLSMYLPKNSFIGTRAWFFFIVNMIKFPLHVIFWKTITWHTLQFDLLVLPFILVGIVTGIIIVKYIPEKTFRYIVMGMVIISAIAMLAD